MVYKGWYLVNPHVQQNPSERVFEIDIKKIFGVFCSKVKFVFELEPKSKQFQMRTRHSQFNSV